MKAVVTSAASFLGRSLVRALRWEGHSVTAVVPSIAEAMATFDDPGIRFVTAVACPAGIVFDTASLAVRRARFNVADIIGPDEGAGSPLGRWIDDIVRRGAAGPATGGTCMVDARDVALAMIAAAERDASGEFTVAGHYARYDHVLASLEEYAAVRTRPIGRVELYPGRHLRSTRVFSELGVEFRPLEETLRDVAAMLRAPKSKEMVA
jgi:nucleoside-diphosphate-sugar epimerase